MNVHGFRDINNSSNRNNVPGMADNMNQNISDSIPFLNSAVHERPPLEETIPYTVKMICCPSIKLFSISVVLSVFMVVAYTFCCTQGITKKNENILEVDQDVLLKYGALQDLYVKKGQVWRLITASFLHLNLLHIVMNLICFIFLLSRLEKTFCPKIIAGILLASNVAGSIFSVLCNSSTTISAGASGMIFGIIGAYLGFMTINWKTLGRYGEVRSQICCTVGLLTFFSILFSFGSDIDIFGHLGGMIGGDFSSLGILPGIEPKNRKMVIGGWVLYTVFMLTTVLIFFLG